MHLINATDFLEKFAESQSVVFVGNGPSMKDSGLGKWIESFDIVVRFNECKIDGYEDDVGSRTDILVINPYVEPKNPDKFLNSLSKDGVVIIISPETRRAHTSYLDHILKDREVLFTFTPDIVLVGDVDHHNGLTTGTYGVFLLSRLLLPSHTAITGFTMFLNNTACHYWQPNMPSGLHAHDIEVEAKIFIKICNKLKNEIVVTEDISWVSRQVNLPLNSKIKLKKD